MAIIGLTTRAGSFPCIGELRKGGVKVSEKRPGPDLTFFRFTSKHPDAVEKFTQAFGDQPTKVDIYLPFPTAAENFDAWIEEWVGGGLKWRGDGQTLVMWQKKDGTYSQEPKPQPQGGKQVGRLKVIIPQLGRLAYVTALTTSIHDIISMSETLAAYEALRGNLQGIPFVLSRVPRMVSTPSGEDGKRARREKWLWHLEAQPQWVMAQLSVMQQAALPKPSHLMLVDSGTGEIFEGEPLVYEDDDEEGEIVETEPPDTVTPATLKNLHVVGNSLYGNGWDKKRAEIVTAKTKGRTASSKELTEEEALALVKGIANKLEAAQKDGQAPTPPPAPEQGTAGDVDGVQVAIGYEALTRTAAPNILSVVNALEVDNVTTHENAVALIKTHYPKIQPDQAVAVQIAVAMYEKVVSLVLPS